MSLSPLPSDGSSPVGTALDRLPKLTRTVVAPARAVAFWAAIALPVLNLALLVKGLSTPAETYAFLGLLLASLVAMVLGHPYGRD